MSPQTSSKTGLASLLAADIRSVAGRLKRRLQEQGGRSDLTPSQVAVLSAAEQEKLRAAIALLTRLVED